MWSSTNDGGSLQGNGEILHGNKWRYQAILIEFGQWSQQQSYYPRYWGLVCQIFFHSHNAASL